MDQPKNEITQFKTLLDRLPYLSEGEKTVACSVYAYCTETMRIDIINFYHKQMQTHQSLVDKYHQEIDQARQEFLDEIKAIAAVT